MVYIVFDNGSYNIKAGFSTDSRPMKQLNTITKAKDGRIYIGNDYINTNNHSGIMVKRPYDQGNLTSWETQKPIWDYTFDSMSSGNKEFLGNDYGLLLTETPFQLPQLSMNTDQIVFEEYGFNSYYRSIAGSLAPWCLPPDNSEFSLIVDCGFSATWIIPVIYKSVYWKGIKKLPVGGKIFNGLLREIISFRHYDITEEPILINTIKESTCFVANDFNEAINNKSKLKCEFVLPDFKTTTTGYVKTKNSPQDADLQSLPLYDERFVIPECLYHPEIIVDNAQSNNHIVQTSPIKNLTDLIIESIMSCPEVARPLLLKNISVVGGTAKLPNFESRLKHELFKELPQDWKVDITSQPYELDEVNWYGGVELANSDIMNKITISKQDYYEHGANWCQKQFGFKNL